MKTLEFRGRVSPVLTLTVPTELAVQLDPDETVRVILVVPTEDEDWDRFAGEEFLKGYAEGDAIYDELPAG